MPPVVASLKNSPSAQSPPDQSASPVRKRGPWPVTCAHGSKSSLPSPPSTRGTCPVGGSVQCGSSDPLGSGRRPSAGSSAPGQPASPSIGSPGSGKRAPARGGAAGGIGGAAGGGAERGLVVDDPDPLPVDLLGHPIVVEIVISPVGHAEQARPPLRSAERGGVDVAGVAREGCTDRELLPDRQELVRPVEPWSHRQEPLAGSLQAPGHTARSSRSLCPRRSSISATTWWVCFSRSFSTRSRSSLRDVAVLLEGLEVVAGLAADVADGDPAPPPPGASPSSRDPCGAPR